MEDLQKDIARLSKMPRLTFAIEDVDKIIELLSEAREQVAGALDPHTASLTMTKLQNPMKERFEAVNEDLREVSKVQRNLGKALDKNFPVKALPTEHDAMAEYPSLINRAIAMHLLREGQFSVATTFIAEAQDNPLQGLPRHSHDNTPSVSEQSPTPELDADMEDDADDEAEPAAPHSGHDLISLQSQELQDKFAEMYRILQELKARNLGLALQWARSNSVELEARGSNLEFELSKLQYVWLFKGPEVNGLPDDEHNGPDGALAYARQHFRRFATRHMREITQLASAIAYAPSISTSPYAAMFSTDSAFNDVAASFTREFCSLLGLSAESPLYIAATAGALALPQLMKFVTATRAKGTEWTTESELPYEVPLPGSMIYHSIFVCPVSKEQTTEENPPMMLPCGHVLARESLTKLCKGTRFKCPYCPSEGQIKDARQIIL